MSLAVALAAAIIVPLAASWIATGLVLRLLRRGGILDRPNARSSHKEPTPRGGGIAIVAVTLAAWLVIILTSDLGSGALVAAAAAALLAGVSWFDDRKGLSPALRLAAQAVCAALGLAVLPGDRAVFQGLLPAVLDPVAAGVLLVWFVNLFNFMDGIDGIAGTEAATVGAGIAVIAALEPGSLDTSFAPLGAAVAAAALGFLCWNWQPARLFMGDVGSVPLGFLLGWLLLALAQAGLWAPALILPLYFLADATTTLIRRMLRGARIWEAHREHLYQRAVQGGLSHAAVVRRVLGANLVFIAASVWAAGGATLAGLLLALVTLVLLVASLRHGAVAAPS